MSSKHPHPEEEHDSSKKKKVEHSHHHDHDHPHHDHDHHHHDHDHDHPHDHHHGHEEHGHRHEKMSHPGLFSQRAPKLQNRDYSKRAYTVGIGGPVGSGKTALVLSLCRHLREKHPLAVVTNDIFTREDGEFLTKHEALSADRIIAVETGGCPHAAIREDIGANLVAVEDLTTKFTPDLVFVESGGDNLAANFSRELADYIIYVIDVAGGDKIPRKGGPGITQSDLLVINKTDLAEAVGADLKIMLDQANQIREGGDVVMAQVKHGVGVDAIANHILSDWKKAISAKQ